MVKILLKRRDENQFLFETSLDTSIQDLLDDILYMFNGRLKISRIVSEMTDLAKHGTMLPENMIGLTDEQITELKLVDTWGETCIPSGGWTFNRDVIGKRNGRQPTQDMQDLIAKSVEEVKAMMSRKQVDAGVCLSQKMVHNALDILKGTIMIIYPMNLPPNDVIRLEFENAEDLSGTHDSQEVIELSEAQLWFCGQHMENHKTAGDYLGHNEKTKVIVKIQKRKEGAPGREPAINEEQRKEMMLQAYRRQEELRKLEQDDDDKYLDSCWADSGSLKRSFQGLSNISWRPK